jgi:hypothetical protein
LLGSLYLGVSGALCSAFFINVIFIP